MKSSPEPTPDPAASATAIATATAAAGVPARRARRAPLRERKRGERRQARARIAAGTRVDLSPAQRARDPLPPLRASRSAAGRLARALAAVVAAVAVHGGVVVVGRLIGGQESGRREVVKQEVKIEVRERKVEPPPLPVEKAPEPEKPVRQPPPPKLAKVTPPPPQAPPPTAKNPPPRVVGLSLESTVEGGGGPAFAVGNTREGQTAERAEAPRDVPPVAPPPPAAPSLTAPVGTNRAATRIPTAGVTTTLPKRRRALKPRYPETLKAQEVEADVPVMVAIDTSGKVTEVKILHETPYPAFNEEARRSAFAEEYEPATRNGVAVPYTLSYVVRFRLEEAE